MNSTQYTLSSEVDLIVVAMTIIIIIIIIIIIKQKAKPQNSTISSYQFNGK